MSLYFHCLILATCKHYGDFQVHWTASSYAHLHKSSSFLPWLAIGSSRLPLPPCTVYQTTSQQEEAQVQDHSRCRHVNRQYPKTVSEACTQPGWLNEGLSRRKTQFDILWVYHSFQPLLARGLDLLFHPHKAHLDINQKWFHEFQASFQKM